MPREPRAAAELARGASVGPANGQQPCFGKPRVCDRSSWSTAALLNSARQRVTARRWSSVCLRPSMTRSNRPGPVSTRSLCLMTNRIVATSTAIGSARRRIGQVRHSVPSTSARVGLKTRPKTGRVRRLSQRETSAEADQSLLTRTRSPWSDSARRLGRSA